MGSKRRVRSYFLTQKQLKAVVNLAKQGMPFNLIAKRFDVTPVAIAGIMTRFGFPKGWRSKKIKEMKKDKMRLVKAELKKNPNIRAALKKYGVSNHVFWYRGISLKNSKEFKIGKKLRPKFLKCKECGASLDNNRFDRTLMCKECGRIYSNEKSKLSHRKNKNKLKSATGQREKSWGEASAARLQADLSPTGERQAMVVPDLS